MTGKRKKRENGMGKRQGWRQGRSILRGYLKERSALLLWYILIVFLFMAVASLYGYDNSVENMWYASALVLFFGLCGCFFDFLFHLFGQRIKKTLRYAFFFATGIHTSYCAFRGSGFK